MIIAICGSMKFADEMEAAQKQLEAIGHSVLAPVRILSTEEYWEEDGAKRVAAKKTNELISEHMDKIEKSDAVLIVNMTKKEIENYVGANTFLEMGYAHYRKKKIYFLHPVPDQPYILDELLAMDPIVLNGDLSRI